ncbi:hypothetical protein PMI18_01029 [Pseudomonas sp. GM102]|nr:hypothetical protein PMI18_01029 [Pseudomonas sp. GM102]
MITAISKHLLLLQKGTTLAQYWVLPSLAQNE